MELLGDVVFLSRLQFALTVIFHFCSYRCPLVWVCSCRSPRRAPTRRVTPKGRADAVSGSRSSRSPLRSALRRASPWSLASAPTGPDYSRFVGDYLRLAACRRGIARVLPGVVLPGRAHSLARKRVSPKFYMVSGWLVWLARCFRRCGFSSPIRGCDARGFLTKLSRRRMAAKGDHLGLLCAQHSIRKPCPRICTRFSRFSCSVRSSPWRLPRTTISRVVTPSSSPR